MLYVIYGKDFTKARSKLTELIDTLQKKRPDASLFRLNGENWNDSMLNELLSGTGLFSPKYIIVIDNLLNNTISGEVVGKSIKEMGKSEHICILIEEKILAADLKKIEKYATKIQQCDIVEKQKKETGAVFPYAEAIAMRDNKKAWVLFQELLRDETVAEEIHGVLWWQFKSLMHARSGARGLSPYVQQKASRAEKLWKDNSLEKALDRLVDMYHLAHRGEIDFLVELEKFSLVS